MSRIALVLLLTLALAPLAAADDALSVSMGASSLDLRPAANYERAVLSIATPDGAVVRREIDNAATISIDLFTLGSGRPADGAYGWELVLAPRLSNEAKAQLGAARGTDREAAVQAELIRRGELPREPMIWSGTFQVQGGTIVQQGETEPRPGRRLPASGKVSDRAADGGPILATRDQVIPDDLIVQASLCVGFDCVNNESFGFDTIRMKENSTRIKFEDTSAAGFPSNDWQLTANDSAAGGANKFSIEDITSARVPFTITAGAATNSIFVDSSSRLGLKTSTPVLDLHINTSNTPSIRLEQNNSGGFTAQTWDIAGNEANFFIRDVTGGSRLPLRIRPGAPTSSIDINASGNIGVGTASPSTSLEVQRSASSAEVMATTISSDGNLFSNMVLRRALGGSTAVTTNSILGTFSFRGHNGTGFPTENNARLEVRAEENFTATANGTRMIFQTTANGAATPSTRMVIKNDGKIGINQNNPTEQLHVTGNVRATSFINPVGPEGGADYVFDPDYELMPLDHLEAFVSENKHLPGIPSAERMQNEGVNLSELQIQLLAKIEELTLYTLKQHETMQNLATQNAELAARLAALEAARETP